MTEITAEEALLKAKEIAARLTGGGEGGGMTTNEAPPGLSTLGSSAKPGVASSTERTERKRKRWGSAPSTASTTSRFGSSSTTGTTGFVAEALPGLAEAKLKEQTAVAKPAGPSSKRVWVPTTRERPETHFASFLKERLSELSVRINSSEFKGDEQNVMELGGRGASTAIIYGMPLEPMHVTIKGSEAFIAAAAPRLEELLAEGERADREGPPPDENEGEKALEGDKDKYSSSALTLTRPYYQGSNAKRTQSEYRPATVAQLISGNPDVLGDALGAGGDGNAELLEESIRIPNGVVGFIIGRGGETISSMQARSGCKVQIQKEHELQPGQTERVITLQAVKQESIDECRAIIESMVRDRVRSAGGSGTHRSSNGGGGGSDYYGRGGAGVGGRTDNTDSKVQEALAGGHKLVKVEVPDADVGLVIGKGGATIKYIQETTGSSVQIPHAADTDNPSVRSISVTCPTEEGAEAAKQQILNIIKNKPMNNLKGSNSNHNNSMNNAAASVEVVVPNKDVGLCIGRQGCVIKQLQSKTNTRIDIPPHPPPGQNIRIIKVTGPTQEACDLAKTYIERIVNEQSSASIMMGSSYNNNFQGRPNRNHYQNGGAGVGYQNQYRNHQNANNSHNNGGNQNSAQSNDPAWQAYYAAQAIANNKQQQQQQQQQEQAAAAASASPASDAYYEQYHRYAYYYGEEAARQYYGTWSPPVGTPNPYGVNPNGITAPPAAENDASAPATTAAATAPQSSAPTNTARVRDSSVRKVSNLPAWMTKS